MWTTVWANSAHKGDNQHISTGCLTTQLQDVFTHMVPCEGKVVTSIDNRGGCPQSTGLIIVIKSSYKHLLSTINNEYQGATL